MLAAQKWASMTFDTAVLQVTSVCMCVCVCFKENHTEEVGMLFSHSN